MLNTFRAAITNLQYQQVRLGSRVRGKAPIVARSLQDRLDELNYKDELYTTRTDIGFPRIRKSGKEIRTARLEHLKKIKADKNLEQLARNHKLQINFEESRKDWLETLAPYHKKQIAEHYGIFEHLYGEGFFIPHLNLEVLYDLKDGSYLPVYSGNVIKPAEAKDVPTVTFESGGNDLWTLALTSLDGHLTENEKEYVHWLVANIPGNHIEKGDVFAEYLQPFPLKGTGFHRYVFVLYKQNGRVDYDLPKVTGTSLDDRSFLTRDWYQKYQDNITPAGLAFYQCDWDPSVKEFFHDTLEIKEPGGRAGAELDCGGTTILLANPPEVIQGRVREQLADRHNHVAHHCLGPNDVVYEYDFPAPYIRPQEWFPRRKPFNLYMDKYRDPKQINKEYLLRKLKNEDPFKAPSTPMRFPNAHPLPRSMPSWLKLHERKIRLGWGRVNDV